jgi:hypothetical protein
MLIGERVYQTARDPGWDYTVIVYAEDGELHDLRDSNDDVMTFSCELEALRYLVGLYVEEHGEIDESWKNLT